MNDVVDIVVLYEASVFSLVDDVQFLIAAGKVKLLVHNVSSDNVFSAKFF